MTPEQTSEQASEQTSEQTSEPWMPNGFPPPSFVVETERVSTFAGPRGRWLAAAAILGALLLIAGMVLIANQDDDDTALQSGSSSTTGLSGTTPTFSPSSSVLDPTATLPEADTVPGGGPAGPGGPTVTGGGGTTPGTPAPGDPDPGPQPDPGPGASPARLSLSTGTVTIPRVDSTVGPGTGSLTLRNSGGSPLSYSTQSTFPGSLTVNKPTGSIDPGGATEVTINLDGSRLAEGGFTGTLQFDGSGGSQRVNVSSFVGRPPIITDNAGESCAEGPTCSKQIKLEPGTGTSLCNTRWRYRVTVADDSQLKAVRADLAQDIELRINGAPNGPGGVWQSEIQEPVRGSFTFTIEAIDQFDYSRRSSPRTITCPA